MLENLHVSKHYQDKMGLLTDKGNSINDINVLKRAILKGNINSRKSIYITANHDKKSNYGETCICERLSVTKDSAWVI